MTKVLDGSDYSIANRVKPVDPDDDIHKYFNEAVDFFIRNSNKNVLIKRVFPQAEEQDKDNQI
jgi:hypothetical protein